jgi:hypothetical protein
MACGRTISINGGTAVTLASLGLRMISRTAVNLDAGQLLLRSVATGWTDEPLLDAKDKIIIREPGEAGAVWFVGYCLAPTLNAGPQGLEWSYTVRDSWHVLMSAGHYLQVTDNYNLIINPFTLSNAWDQLDEGFQHVSADLQLGTFAPLPNLYYRQHPLSNDSLAVNVNHILKEVPYGGLYIDYSTTPPTLTTTYVEEDEITLAWGSVVTAAQLTNRADLKPNDVAFRYLYDFDSTWGTLSSYLNSLVPSWQQTTAVDPTGDYPNDAADNIGGRDVLMLYISQRGWATAFGLDLNSTSIQAITDFVYTQLQADVWQGNVVCRGVDLGVVTGATLHISGARSDWATANLLVQRVEEDLVNETTTLTIGMPERFDSGDLFEYALTLYMRSQFAGHFPSLSDEVFAPPEPDP